MAHELAQQIFLDGLLSAECSLADLALRSEEAYDYIMSIKEWNPFPYMMWQHKALQSLIGDGDGYQPYYN